MILTVDVGNTNIVLGGFVKGKLAFVSRMATDTHMTNCEYAVKIREILALYGIEKQSVKGAIISSVVPPVTNPMKSAINMVYGVKALVVGPGIKTGINLMVDNPAQVGAA